MNESMLHLLELPHHVVTATAWLTMVSFLQRAKVEAKLVKCVGQDAAQMVMGLLQFKATDRPTAAQALQLPLFDTLKAGDEQASRAGMLSTAVFLLMRHPVESDCRLALCRKQAMLLWCSCAGFAGAFFRHSEWKRSVMQVCCQQLSCSLAILSYTIADCAVGEQLCGALVLTLQLLMFEATEEQPSHAGVRSVAQWLS